MGTLRPEFELLDAPFDDRGPRADDAIRALRAGWATEVPSYHGTHYHFDDLVIDPTGVQTRVPIWLGGRTAQSLRRAVALGDGWMPFGLDRRQIATMLERHAPLPTGFQVVLQSPPLDPLGDPDGTRRAVQAVGDAGATIVNAKFVHLDRDHLLRQMRALTALFPHSFPTESASPEAPITTQHAEENP